MAHHTQPSVSACAEVARKGSAVGAAATMQRAVPSALRLLQQACYGGCAGGGSSGWAAAGAASRLPSQSDLGSTKAAKGRDGGSIDPILGAGMLHSTPLGPWLSLPPAPRLPGRNPRLSPWLLLSAACKPPRPCACAAPPLLPRTGPAGGATAAASTTRSLSSHTFSGFADAPPAAGSKSISIKASGGDGANVSVDVTVGGASAKASYPAASIKT